MRGRRARLLAVLAAAIAAESCLAGREGLGVDDPEAIAMLARHKVALALPDGVYLVRGDGGERRRVAASSDLGEGAGVFLASLAPDGSKVLFLSASRRDARTGSARSLSLHILTLRDDEAAAWREVRLDRLLGDGLSAVDPSMTPGAAWSHDGRLIALALRRPASLGSDSIAILDDEGAPRRSLELAGPRLVAGSGLAWSAAGDALLVAVEDPGEQQNERIASIAIDGEGASMAPLAPGRDPAVSRDGRRLAVVERRDDGPGDIVLLDGGGREIDRFERPAGRGLNHLFWSGDGRYLYYHSLASTGPLGILEVGVLRCLDTRSRRVFDLVRLG